MDHATLNPDEQGIPDGDYSGAFGIEERLPELVKGGRPGDRPVGGG